MSNTENSDRPVCPKCGWRDVRLSATRGLIDTLLSTLSLAAWRCRTCNARFYRLRRRAEKAEEKS